MGETPRNLRKLKSQFALQSGEKLSHEAVVETFLMSCSLARAVVPAEVVMKVSTKESIESFRAVCEKKKLCNPD